MRSLRGCRAESASLMCSIDRSFSRAIVTICFGESTASVECDLTLVSGVTESVYAVGSGKKSFLSRLHLNSG